MVLVVIPIVRECYIFKRGHEGTGLVVNISSFKDMNKNEKYMISVKYDVDGQTYSKTFNLKKEECELKIGDTVTLLYDFKNPQNAHISADSSSCFRHFQRLIIMMTVIAVSMIGLRSILLYFSSANNSSLLSLISLAMIALIILIILGIYIAINARLSHLKNIIDGEIIDKIDNKDTLTYKVKYKVRGCFFTYLCNSKDDMEIGTKIKVTYLENIPFIARIAK